MHNHVVLDNAANCVVNLPVINSKAVGRVLTFTKTNRSKKANTITAPVGVTIYWSDNNSGNTYSLTAKNLTVTFRATSTTSWHANVSA